jgi:hypothetical protein
MTLLRKLVEGVVPAGSGDGNFLEQQSNFGSYSLAFDGTHYWGRLYGLGNSYVRFSADGSFKEQVSDLGGSHTNDQFLYELSLDRIVVLRDANTAPILSALSKAIPSVKTDGAVTLPAEQCYANAIAGGGYIWLYHTDGVDGSILRVPADLSDYDEFLTLTSAAGCLAFDTNTTRYGDSEGRLFVAGGGTTPSKRTVARVVPSTGAMDAEYTFGAETYDEIYAMSVDPTTGRLWVLLYSGMGPGGTTYVIACDCDTFGGNLRDVALPGTQTPSAIEQAGFYGSAAVARTKVGMGTAGGALRLVTDPGSGSDLTVAGSQVLTVYSGTPGIGTHQHLHLSSGPFGSIVARYATLDENDSAYPYYVGEINVNNGGELDISPSALGWSPAVKIGGDLGGLAKAPAVYNVKGGQGLSGSNGQVAIWNAAGGLNGASVPRNQQISNGATALEFPYQVLYSDVAVEDDPKAIDLEAAGFESITENAGYHVSVADIGGMAGRGSYLTLTPVAGVQTPNLAYIDGLLPEGAHATSMLLRSAYERIDFLQRLTYVDPNYVYTWVITNRYRQWERIETDADVTLESGYALVMVDTTAAVEVTLIANPQEDDWVIIKDATGNAGTMNITVSGNGTDTIDGAASKTISDNYGYLALRYDSTLAEWNVVDSIAAGTGSYEDVSINHSLASGANNDVSPTGWAGANMARLDSPAAASITGLVAVTSVDRRVKKLYNVGTYDITLKHQDTGSTAANRLIIPGATDLVLAPNDVVDVSYDLTTARWRVG